MNQPLAKPATLRSAAPGVEPQAFTAGGPVAALHETIQASFATRIDMATSLLPEHGPDAVQRAVAEASRLLGPLSLAAAYAFLAVRFLG
jgi:hypothetical protein